MSLKTNSDKLAPKLRVFLVPTHELEVSQTKQIISVSIPQAEFLSQILLLNSFINRVIIKVCKLLMTEDATNDKLNRRGDYAI